MSRTYRSTDYLDAEESLEFADWEDLITWLNKSDLKALYPTLKQSA
jgi:hypothetical protein